MIKYIALLIKIALLLLNMWAFSSQTVYAEQAAPALKPQTILTAAFPYSLDNKLTDKVYAGSTAPLYIAIEGINHPQSEVAVTTVVLPAGFRVGKTDIEWQQTLREGALVLESNWNLTADYAQSFSLLPVTVVDDLPSGSYTIEVSTQIGLEQFAQEIVFEVVPAMAVGAQADGKQSKQSLNWYIQGLTLPVDKDGLRDAKLSEGTVLIRDLQFESFRNRMTGGGVTNWGAVLSHPATHLLLELRNPKNDVKVLKFKAELLDKNTGEVVPGLLVAGTMDNNEEHAGWGATSEKQDASTALLALDGLKNQTFIVPLYVDAEHITEGEYNLRVSVFSNSEKKIAQVPLQILKKSNLSLFSVGFSFVCAFILFASFYRLRATIISISAKGAITVALFAAVAFGSIVVPTTLGGDLLRVFLGPFTSLVTGLLNGTLLYLLLMALVTLYRRPGIVALLFLVKWLMAGLMFGRFTPLSLLLYSVYIVTLEGALYLTGYYRQTAPTKAYMLLLALVIGCVDAFVTLINIEQMMFFYRLYYADWYIALYMLVNGLLYSSIGCYMGFKVGKKMQQVMGE